MSMKLISSPCSATEDYVFTVDSDSGDVVWEGTSSGCNWTILQSVGLKEIMRLCTTCIRW